MLPKLKKTITKFLLGEEGKITKNSLIKVGAILSFTSLSLLSHSEIVAGHDSHTDAWAYDNPIDCPVPAGYSPTMLANVTNLGKCASIHGSENTLGHDNAECDSHSNGRGHDNDKDSDICYPLGSSHVRGDELVFHKNELHMTNVGTAIITTHNHDIAGCAGGKDHSNALCKCHGNGGTDDNCDGFGINDAGGRDDFKTQVEAAGCTNTADYHENGCHNNA